MLREAPETSARDSEVAKKTPETPKGAAKSPMAPGTADCPNRFAASRMASHIPREAGGTVIEIIVIVNG